MSEGDSVHFLARRLRPVLVERAPEAVLTPNRRGALARPGRLAGRRITAVDAYGKHLFLHFAGHGGGPGLVLHSHLGMTGSWRLFPRHGGWSRSPRAAWVVIRGPDLDLVQFGGPTLEVMTEARRRSHPRLAALGPDICADAFEPLRALGRLRRLEPDQPLGAGLLDQRVVAGIGNLWKVEACWLAGISPWRAIGETGDDEVLAILAAARPRMLDSARHGRQWRFKRIYGTAGRRCPRCSERIRQRPQGEGARLTYWCPGCQV